MCKSLFTMVSTALVFLLFSCCKISDSKTDKEQEAVHNLVSGILQLDSASLSHCDSILTNTSDCLEYCDYALIKARHTLLTSNIQDVIPLISKVETYISHQPSTPRARGIQAFCSSIRAAYLRHYREAPDSIITLNIQAYNNIIQSNAIEMAPDVAANLGDAYVTVSDMPSASKWYRRALFLADSLKQPKERSVSLHVGLGQIYTFMRDFESARHSYEYAEKYYEGMQPNMKSYYLNNYGNYFYYKRDYKNALVMFKRLSSMLIEHDMADHFDMALCKINLADVYLNLNMLDSAEIYVKEADAFFRKKDVSVAIYYANTINIGIALKRGNYGDIGHILSSERDIIVTEQSMKDIRNRYLVEYYAKTGHYKQAYENVINNIAQNDSLQHNLTNMRTSDIMTRFMEDTLRLHHKLEIEEKNVTVSRQNTLLIALALFVVTTILILLYIISHMHRSRLQANLNILMLRLANTRQRISPHFIFNVLNAKIVSASKEDQDILVDMAKLIRLNLEVTGKEYVSLKEEFDFVLRYIEFQRILIGENFELQTNIPNQELQSKIFIPTMFLQILIENAIKHGLRNVEGHKLLKITISQDDNILRIDVIDNGPGFDIRYEESTIGKTGLNIIKQTIAILNHNNDGQKLSFNIANITTESGKIQGCKSSLSIPQDFVCRLQPKPKE